MPRGDSSPDLIREAALELFALHGVGATSLQMIADRLGVTKAALYHHHRTKLDIVRAVLAPAMAQVSEIVESASALKDPDEASRRAVQLLADHAVASRTLYSVVLRGLPADLGAAAPGMTEVFARLRHLIAAGRDDPTRAAAVSIFLGGLASFAIDPELDGLSEEQLRAAVTQIGDLLFR